MSESTSIISSLRWVTAVAVAEVDLSGRLLDANAGFLRLLPGQRPAGIGKASRSLFRSPTFERLIELAPATGKTVSCDLLTLGEADGLSRSLRGSVTRTPAGLYLLLEHDIEELEHVCATSLELSDDLAMTHRQLLSINRQLTLAEAARGRYKERVRLSEERLRRVLDNLPVATCLLRSDGEILWGNRAVIDSSRGPSEGLVGRRVWDPVAGSSSAGHVRRSCGKSASWPPGRRLRAPTWPSKRRTGPSGSWIFTSFRSSAGRGS